MALFIAEDTDSTFTVRPGENTLQAAASALTAEGWADAAAVSAATAESAAGPTYASTAAGLAATTSGQAFAVAAGGGLVSIYLNSAGTAVFQRTLATTGALAASSGAALVGFLQAGAGAVARTVQDKLLEQLRSTTDYSSIAQALTAAAGGAVLVPTGNTTGPSPIISSGALVLEGRGEGSILTRTIGSDAGPVNFLQSDGNLSVSDLTINLDVDAGATSGLNVFRWNDDGVVFDNVVADGAVIVNPSTGGWNTFNNICRLPVGHTEDKTGLRVSFSRFNRFFWGFLKANNIASTERDIDILFSEFRDFASVALLFNSPDPGSLQEFIKVIGNRLGTNFSRQDFGLPVGNPSATFPHRATFAGNVENVIFALNQADGDGGEIVRAEEGARAVIMSLNTAKLNGRDGIEIIANNAGGTTKTPRFFAVTSNVLDHRGLVSATQKGSGILLFTKTELGRVSPLDESVVAHNIVHNFDNGLRTFFEMRRNIIADNVLTQNGTSIQTHDPSLTFRDNLSIDPSVRDIRFERPGLLGRQHFVSETGVRKAIVSTATGKPALAGWTWETGVFDVPGAGPNWYKIINIGDRIGGRIKIALSDTAVPPSSWGYEVGTITYDGSTLTYTSQMRYVSGTAQLSGTPLRVNGGDLEVNVSAGAAYPGMKLQIEFDGLHVFGTST